MGLLQNIIKGVGKNREEFKKKFKEAQEDRKINHMIDEREKSANQRELERYMNEERENLIKKKLEKIHNQQNTDNWKGTHSVLAGKATMMKTDRPILKEKNIFQNSNKIAFMHRGNSYFK